MVNMWWAPFLKLQVWITSTFGTMLPGGKCAGWTYTAWTIRAGAISHLWKAQPFESSRGFWASVDVWSLAVPLPTLGALMPLFLERFCGMPSGSPLCPGAKLVLGKWTQRCLWDEVPLPALRPELVPGLCAPQHASCSSIMAPATLHSNNDSVFSPSWLWFSRSRILS